MLLFVMLLGFDYCKDDDDDDDDDDDGRMWWLWSSCYVLAWIKVSKMMVTCVIWISNICVMYVVWQVIWTMEYVYVMPWMWLMWWFDAIVYDDVMC